MSGKGKPQKAVQPPSMANTFTKPMPMVTAEPPPTFPELDPPFPPLTNVDELLEENKDLLEIVHDFNNRMRRSPYFFKNQPESDGIERYSDKYKNDQTTYESRLKDIPFNTSFFPDEILDIYEAMICKKERKRAKKTDVNIEKVIADVGETQNEDEEEEEEEEIAEEDDDENDYNANYFDPGDEYIDIDDGDDEPSY